MGQKRPQQARAPSWGKHVDRAPEHRADTPASHPSPGQKCVPHTSTYGTHVNNTPQCGAKNRSLGQTRQHDGLQPAWDRHVNSAPQRGAKTSILHPRVGHKHPNLPPHGADTSATHPCVGHTRQQHALAWGKHNLLGPQRGADTSTAELVPRRGPQTSTVRPSVGEPRPHEAASSEASPSAIMGHIRR